MIMKGLELSKLYYEEYGKKMIHEKFSNIESKIAIGLIGAGSECIGCDDDISKDHDFDIGFMIFIPDDLDPKIQFELEREYSYLPNEYMGYKKNVLSRNSQRRGVIKVSDFLTEKIGKKDGNLSLYDFLYIDEQYLLEVTNGKIYRDDSNIITKIRINLNYMPIDVKLKKIAGEILIMSQSGQYNYLRLKKRNDVGDAKLAINIFVNSFIHFVYLINEVYMPYYKWRFKILKQLSWPKIILKYKYDFIDKLIFLLSVNPQNIFTPIVENIINDMSNICIDRIKKEFSIDSKNQFLDFYAIKINDSIKNNEIRNLNILTCV